MNERLTRPRGKPSFSPPQQSKPPAASPTVPLSSASLLVGGDDCDLLDETQENVALAEILAAMSADSAPANEQRRRLHEVENAIRRHWAVLRNLVHEHALLSRTVHGQPERPHAPVLSTRNMPRISLFKPPERAPIIAAE
jgi:hypothetical protein